MAFSQTKGKVKGSALEITGGEGLFLNRKRKEVLSARNPIPISKHCNNQQGGRPASPSKEGKKLSKGKRKVAFNSKGTMRAVGGKKRGFDSDERIKGDERLSGNNARSGI